MTTTTKNSEKIVPVAPLQIDLRDWFAGQAMIGLCSGINSSSDAWLINCAADLAYQIADTMMEARK